MFGTEELLIYNVEVLTQLIIHSHFDMLPLNNPYHPYQIMICLLLDPRGGKY